MRKKSIVVFILLSVIALISISISADSGDAKKEIESLFTAWNSSLQTGNPDTVAKNYANDAILLPTVSNKVRHNHKEIKDYFEHFLKLKPEGKINEENIRIYGDIALNSGCYTFNIMKDGKSKHVKARFTFVYRKIGDKWLIIEHHSSVMPEKE